MLEFFPADPSFDDFFFQWVKYHDDISLDVADRILEIAAKREMSPTLGYFLLVLYSKVGLQKCLEAIGATHALCDTFDWIIHNKRRFLLSARVISDIRSFFEMDPMQLNLLLSLLSHFGVTDFDSAIVLPLTRSSFWNTVELLVAKREGPTEAILAAITDIAASELESLEIAQIRILSQIVHFNRLFSHPGLSLSNEDLAVFYASLCERPDWSLVNYSHVSLRLISFFTSRMEFQFEFETPSFLSELVRDKVYVDFSRWSSLSPPRRPILERIALFDVSQSSEFRHDFSFLGVSEVFVASEISDSITNLVIWQSLPEAPTLSVQELLDQATEIRANVAISSRALSTLSGEDGSGDWTSLFAFEDDAIEIIDWALPPRDFLFLKEDLMLLAVEEGVDEFFGSIPCQIHNGGNVASVVEMKTSRRLFAAKLPRIGVFNFDLGQDLPPAGNFVRCGILKQMYLTLAWLLNQ
jgi:hypothetical protein